MTRVAVIGAGLIGRAWSIVFARAGFDVALWDRFPQAVPPALDFIAERLPELRENGLLADEPAAVMARIRPAKTLAEALCDADYVQENGPERIDVKIPLFAELDRLARPDAVLASSTSGIPASAFTEGLRGRSRCLVAHPVNPPYLIPLVEICPAPWTDEATVARTREIMTQAGQVPATVKKELDGFALNRLQGGRRHFSGRSGCAGEAWPGASMELYGTAGNHRPERAGRAGGLLRPIRAVIREDARTDDSAGMGCNPGPEAERRPPRGAAGKHAAGAAGMARPPADGAAGAQGGAAE
jgi:hypothetical protein